MIRLRSTPLQVTSPPSADLRRKNRRHWNANLDPQNLGGGGGAVPLERQMDLAATADVREALEFLAPLAHERALDLGGGLGLHAIMLAREGASVVIADLSTDRLREARRIANHFGVDNRVHFVVCAAEELPFRDGAFTRQLTKSVLIHADLEPAAAELARTLSPGGRACFIEPLTRNPFVWLYRKLAAPKEWKEIARYFTPERLALLAQPFRGGGARVRFRRRYLFAFLATPLNYTFKRPRAYRAAETILLAIDNLLFLAAPFLRRFCWFCLVQVRNPRTAKPNERMPGR